MKTIKKFAALLLALSLLFALSACGGKDSPNTPDDSADGHYTIGISQYGEHGSLDNCREGFLQGLAEEGIVEGENLITRTPGLTTASLPRSVSPSPLMTWT